MSFLITGGVAAPGRIRNRGAADRKTSKAVHKKPPGIKPGERVEGPSPDGMDRSGEARVARLVFLIEAA